MAFFKRRRGISLTSFVRGIVKALTDAQQAIPHSREDHLRHHMTVDKEGVLTPKMFTVNMEDGRRINIPTYNFASVNTIGISSATIKCAARIVDLDQTDEVGDMTVGKHHAIFTVQAGNTKNTFEIEIAFQEKEPSEAGARLMESLDSMIDVEHIEHD